jgi:hypothetical protein
MIDPTETNEEIVLNDNQIIRSLTDAIKPAKSKELTLQSLIAMLNEEYGFEMSDMERNFPFTYVDLEGKNKRKPQGRGNIEIFAKHLILTFPLFLLFFLRNPHRHGRHSGQST